MVVSSLTWVLPLTCSPAAGGEDVSVVRRNGCSGGVAGMCGMANLERGSAVMPDISDVGHIGGVSTAVRTL